MDVLLDVLCNHNAIRGLGTRCRITVVTDDLTDIQDLSNVKVDDDLKQVLAKARLLRQKESVIQKPPPMEMVMKQGIKEEEDHVLNVLTSDINFTRQLSSTAH